MCKYFCWRTRKGIKYKYCRLSKGEIEYENCHDCKNKEYKQYKKQKSKKHKRTIATDIQKGVKEAVWKRDGYECIFCHEKVPMFNSNAHFIPRSQGGLGIEENIFTACDKCHQEQDNGLKTQKMEKEVEEYLKSKYEDWNKENLVYKKYKF